MRSGPREGVELICPFCRTPLARPRELQLRSAETVSGGRCATCGALYLLDPTGRNVGEVMTQALAITAEELSRDLTEIVPGEDYDDMILSYDWRTHRSAGEATHHLDRSGRLYVIRIKKKDQKGK